MKVLVVDDNPAGLDVVSSMLRDEGYTLVTCADGMTALDLVVRELPEVLLLDVMMPGVSGFEVCRRIRATEAVRDISIILLTALNDRASRLEGFSAGADDFMSKPLDSIELRLRLRTLARLNRFRERLQTRSYYEDLARLSPDGIISLDVAGTTMGGNPKAIELLGELRGRSLTSLVAEADRDHAAAAWSNSTGDPVHPTVFRAHVVGVGGPFPAELTIKRLVGDAGGEAILVVRNLSDVVRVQARLERAERLESLALASGGVAHDFANALVAVQGAIQLAEAMPGSPVGQDALREARGLIGQATSLVRRINQFARPEAHQQKTLDLRILVEEAGSLLTHLAEDVSLVFELAPGPSLVSADATEVTQLLTSLVTNARDASGEADRVTIRTIRREMTTPKGVVTCGWCVQVADTGTGMPPDVLARVYEPYFTTKPTSGTGLGLPTAKAIAERNGGSITIESEVGTGTTVTVCLPALNPGLAEGAN